jgi:hypothetical protein
MKNVSLVCIVALISLSIACKKTNQPKLPASEFSFSANGAQYVFNGSYYANKGSLIQRSWLVAFIYSFWGQSTEEYLNAAIAADKIEEKTYPVSFQAHLGKIYYDSSHNCTVTIIRLQNNLASGVFSGEVFISGKSMTPLIISNGKFKDVLVKD